MTTKQSKQSQSRTIKSLSDLITQTEELLSKANRTIKIYTYNLDPRILNSRKIEETILQFIRTSRFVRVELLIHHESTLQRVDHRLVRLAQNFSSFITIRLIPRDYHENPFAFYLIDDRYMLYRNQYTRFEAEIQELPNSQLKQKTKYFDEIWQKSSPAVHLRALII